MFQSRRRESRQQAAVMAQNVIEYEVRSFNRAVANPASKPASAPAVQTGSQKSFNRAVANPASKPLPETTGAAPLPCFNRAVANPASKPPISCLPKSNSSLFQSRRRESRQQAAMEIQSRHGPHTFQSRRRESRQQALEAWMIPARLLAATFQSRRRESRQQASALYVTFSHGVICFNRAVANPASKPSKRGIKQGLGFVSIAPSRIPPASRRI